MAAVTFTIGEAAARAGVSRDTLRYYERKGILPRTLRTQAGYRTYTDAAVEQIRFVRHALRFGFSVNEIAAFLGARRAGHPPCRQVRARGGEILADIDRRLADLATARAEVAATLERWDRALAATAAGQPAGLLQMIAWPEAAANACAPSACAPLSRRSRGDVPG